MGLDQCIREFFATHGICKFTAQLCCSMPASAEVEDEPFDQRHDEYGFAVGHSDVSGIRDEEEPAASEVNESVPMEGKSAVTDTDTVVVYHPRGLTDKTNLCGSFEEYLRVRDGLVGKFSVHVEESRHDAWQKISSTYVDTLKRLPCMRGLALHWIGSTAVPGLAAKPIIDLLVGTETDVAITVRSIAEDMALPEWNSKVGLHFPIGFIGMNGRGDHWGFLQLPSQIAERLNLMGCNLHVLMKSSTSYREEVAMVHYLSSNLGQALKRKYEQTKKDLANAIKLAVPGAEVNTYSDKKNAIVEEIFQAAREAGFLKDDVVQPVQPVHAQRWHFSKSRGTSCVASFSGADPVEKTSDAKDSFSRSRLALDLEVMEPPIDGSSSQSLYPFRKMMSGASGALSTAGSFHTDLKSQQSFSDDETNGTIGTIWMTRVASGGLEDYC